MRKINLYILGKVWHCHLILLACCLPLHTLASSLVPFVEEQVLCPSPVDKEVLYALDSDGNGLVSIVEAVSNLPLLDAFHVFDTDRDKYLSRSELARCYALVKLPKKR